MPRRLLLVNVLLGGIAIASAGFIAGQLVTPFPVPPPPRPPTAASAVTVPVPEAPRPPASAHDVIATHNLFRPTRADEQATAPAAAAPAAPKPNLYGVLLRDQNPIAYLEDPQTKRVASYQIGDAIAGGTLQTITADRVVIARPDGPMDVRLRDPSTPRTASAATPVAPIAHALEDAAPAGSPQQPTDDPSAGMFRRQVPVQPILNGGD